MSKNAEHMCAYTWNGGSQEETGMSKKQVIVYSQPG